MPRNFAEQVRGLRPGWATGSRDLFFSVFSRIRKIAKSDCLIRHVTAWNSSAPAGRIFMKFAYCENLLGSLFDKNLT